MGITYLIRHGQASFGAADYDALSPLGHQQAQRLGAHWRERGLAFDSVLCGTLRRHRQTLAGIAAGLAAPALEADALAWPGLNEYDPDALLRAQRAQRPPAQPLPARGTPEGYRAHFRLLREALLAWMAGEIAPEGMPSHADFVAGVTGALDHIAALPGRDRRVLVVSSGGPIATAVGVVLGVPAASVVELNLQIRNTALTELSSHPRGHRLLSFNHLPHLDGAAWPGWTTHA